MTDTAHHHNHHELYGRVDPASSIARVRSALIDSGKWIEGMDITDIVCLARSRYPVVGGAIYTLHELYPLGPTDPDLVTGILRKALRRHEGIDHLPW